MSCRTRRFEKEKPKLPYTIIENESYTNMPVMPHLTLTLFENYPFTPPKLCINNVDYITYLVKLYSPLKPFVDRFHMNIHCICCDSVICSWTPCYGVKRVVNECISYTKKIRTVQYCKRIFERLNLDDLVLTNIASYVL